MSAVGEAKARRTPERGGRSPGPKGPTASDGGGRNAIVTSRAARASPRDCAAPTRSGTRMLSGAENRIGLEQHIDVRDAVLIVGQRRRSKAKARVERFQLLLCVDPDRLPGPCLRRTRDALRHQHATQSDAAVRMKRQYAPDRRLGELAPRVEH